MAEGKRGCGALGLAAARSRHALHKAAAHGGVAALAKQRRAKGKVVRERRRGKQWHVVAPQAEGVEQVAARRRSRRLRVGQRQHGDAARLGRRQRARGVQLRHHLAHVDVKVDHQQRLDAAGQARGGGGHLAARPSGVLAKKIK